MMKERLLFCFAAAVFMLPPASASAEKIVTKAGSVVDQKIVQTDEKQFITDFYGVRLTYFWDDVESIDGKSPDVFRSNLRVDVPLVTPVPAAATAPAPAPPDDVPNVPPPALQSPDQIRPSAGRITFGLNSDSYTRDISSAIRANRWGELMDLYLLRSIAYEREGQLSKVVNDYRLAGEVDAKYARFFFLRMKDGGIPVGAVDLILKNAEARISSAGPAAEALSKRGYARFLKGDFDRSIADYRKALEKEPQNMPVRQEYVFILLLLGDYQACVKEATAALAIDPNQAIMHVYRGSARFSLGDTNAALADYSRAVALDPSEPECYIARAYLSEFINMDSDPAPVIRDLDAALAHAPANVFLVLKKTAASLKNKDLDAALRECGEAIKFDPENPRAYFMLGKIYAEMKDPAKALEALDKALAFCDTDGDIYEARARVHYWEREYEECLSDIEKASEFGNDVAEFRATVKKAIGR
jgi:tetratricopeptide (TPR) repeat protein